MSFIWEHVWRVHDICFARSKVVGAKMIGGCIRRLVSQKKGEIEEKFKNFFVIRTMSFFIFCQL